MLLGVSAGDALRPLPGPMAAGAAVTNGVGAPESEATAPPSGLSLWGQAHRLVHSGPGWMFRVPGFFLVY
jgi:hypothetical protein